MATLYLVGTPIGNLEDMTLRAIRVLKEVSVVAAEDTRRARKLFARHGIATPLTTYHEQGRHAKLPDLLRRLRDQDVALITEAGMPVVSDPGYSLVTAALEQGVRVEAVPGPSAVTTALAVSGLPPEPFLFLGFLPRVARARRRLLTSVVGEPHTLVLFEAPHRLEAALREIDAIFGQRRLAVCRELTKLHEEVFRGTAAQALAHFRPPRGEFTLVIAGRDRPPEPAGDAQVRARLRQLRDEDVGPRKAVALATQESGRPRREVYRLWVELGRKG
ncbi:MAG: 16S rRNA (cytidine(1402)-2'-O)-methyltransferase [Dehalococcoidia bacterium]